MVATGISFGEGPVWVPDGVPGAGTLLVTSVSEGAVYRVQPGTGAAERLADTGGGANGAALAADGSVLVTQNGGVDLASTELFEHPPPFRPVTPGIQLVSPDGTRVEYVVADGFRAPNDLAVAADGTVYFTDPGPYPPPEPDTGRVIALSRDGAVRVHADGFFYCNGIGFEPDGHLVVVERAGLQRLRPDGTREWVVETLGRGAGDGFCVDVEGRFYVASTIAHGIRVVDPDGTVVELLPIDGEGLTTNCCFGGPDLRTLFATDALPGQLVAFEGMPSPGLPLPRWPGPDRREPVSP